MREPGGTPSWSDHPDPDGAPGQSLVRVTAAPVVPLDLLCASGTSYFGRPAVPYVPGVQGVGVVTGPAVLPVGTRVWFATSAGMAPGDGSLAKQCRVADADLVPITDDVPDAAAAALGLSAVAAWMALTWRARVGGGGGGGGLRGGGGGGGAVGQTAVGAARLLGAARVVAVCRSTSSAERALRAGADAVVELTEDV